MSAGTLLRLDLSREIVEAAISKLCVRRPGQVNLVRCAPHALLRTWGGNDYDRRECGSADTFDYMLHCFGPRSHMARGPAAADILVRMSKGTFPRGAQRPRPRHLGR